MNTASATVDFTVVAITWDDAVYHSGPLDAQELDAAARPSLVTTIGYLVRESQNGYLVAAEVHHDLYQQQWRSVSFIPKGMVRGVQRLGGAS